MASATTEGERRILAEAPSGEPVDLGDLPDEQRVVSADVIRRLCVGSGATTVDARGIRIKRARIAGPLDLSFCDVPHPLRFEATTFDATPDLTGAHLPALWFRDCSLPGVLAERVQAGEIRLDLCTVMGGVRLLDARIAGQLNCAGATLADEGGDALTADGAEITGGVFLREGFSATGAVRLLRARIGGPLNCRDATLRNTGGEALSADGAEIKGGVFLHGRFNATGRVRLAGAKIGGHVNCSGATLCNEGGVALSADGAVIGRDLLLGDGFSAAGEVRLLGAKIGGQLNCTGASLTHEGGDALSADEAEIGGEVFLRADFSATGTVRLPGARIGGGLDCVGATLSNENGVALMADGAEIGGYVFLRQLSASGEMRIPGARIGGELYLEGATLSNEGADYGEFANKAALYADKVEVSGGVYLSSDFSATGTVQLVGAKIGGDLYCQGAKLSNKQGYALWAERAEIAGGVDFRNGFNATGEVRLIGIKIGGDLNCRYAKLVNTRWADSVALELREAIIGGTLYFDVVEVSGGVDLFRASSATLVDDLGSDDHPLGSWDGVQPLILEGFAYARFGEQAEWSSKLRRRWLKATTGFQQGAWQRLIEVYRAQGLDDEAARAAIAMQDDRVARAGLPWYRRAGRFVLWAVVGHGYRPWLAGLWAAAIIAAFALVVWHWSGMFVPKQGSASPQPVAYATDTFLPIVNLGQADEWQPTGWVRWIDWSVILLGWALTTLFVAGFTRIVRNE